MVIHINEMFKRKMRGHVSRCFPSEACGLLAGLGGTVKKIYKIKNDSLDPKQFRMNPEEQLKAFMDMEHLGLQLLAIYHSHPMDRITPSEQDTRQHYDPTVISLIWSFTGKIWNIHAYAIQGKTFRSVRVDWADPA